MMSIKFYNIFGINISLRLMKTVTIFIYLLVYQISAQIQQINQIINGKFTNPGLPSNFLSKLYDGKIEGWTCSSFCQILNCTKLQQYYPTVNQTTLKCSEYTIDLNSAGLNQQLSQTLALSFEYYWLYFDYLYPQYNAKFKQLQIIFNQQILFSVKPDVLFSIKRYQFQMRVNGKDGKNRLSFKEIGYQLDGTGFKIANVSLNREYNVGLENTINYFFQLQFMQKGQMIPGIRYFFRSLMSFMVNFDRMQFYSYHNRQYSANVNKFLRQIRLLQSIKGTLMESKLREWFPSYIQKIDLFFSHSEKKMGYINYNISDEDEKHQTFSSYIKYFVTFMMPIITIIFLLLHIMFNLTKNWAISIILRPYAFYSTLIFVCLQGNLEEIAFHGFGDLKYFFSFSYQQKILNFLSLSVLFIAVFTCFGLYLWLKVHYSKKTRIITDSKDETVSALLSTNFDKAIVISLLGLSHQILLSTPKIQMSVLITIQTTWLVKIILTRNLAHYKQLVVVWILQSLLRIYFQVTCVLYTYNENQRITINNQYHSVLIFALIIIISIDIVLNTYFMLKKFFTGKIFRKNKVIQLAKDIVQISIIKEHKKQQKKSFQTMREADIINEIQFNRKVASLTARNNLSHFKRANIKDRAQTIGLKQTKKSTFTIRQRLRQMKLKTQKKKQIF